MYRLTEKVHVRYLLYGISRYSATYRGSLSARSKLVARIASEVTLYKKERTRKKENKYRAPRANRYEIIYAL